MKKKISGNCFYKALVLFLIPEFVSANIQFKLIMGDKFSSLQVFFLSFSFFSSLSFYKSVCFVREGRARVHVRFSFFFYYTSFPLIIYYFWYGMKFSWQNFFLPKLLCVCVRACACICFFGGGVVFFVCFFFFPFSFFSPQKIYDCGCAIKFNWKLIFLPGCFCLCLSVCLCIVKFCLMWVWIFDDVFSFIWNFKINYPVDFFIV